MKIFDFYNIDLEGKDVTIIGRSIHIGKALYSLLLNRNCTVTLCHSKTKDVKKHTKKSDIVITSVGKADFLSKDMVKKGAVVVDIGINKVEGKLVGDVDFNGVSEIASYITPVPKGVGPMTIATLMINIVDCYKEQKRRA